MKNKPDQLVPKSQKGQEFCKTNVNYFAEIAKGKDDSKKQDIQCWLMYYNVWNEEEFDYLRKIPNGTQGENDYYLPAKMKYIPIQRSKLDYLVSTQRHRPWVFSIALSDNASKQEKYFTGISEAVKGVRNAVDQVNNQYEQALIGINQQQQELQQLLSKQPESEEEAAQIQELQKQLPYINHSLTNISSNIQEEITKNHQDSLKAKRLEGYTEKDWKEDVAQKTMYMLRQKLNIERKSVKNFVSHIVTGKQAYYVDFIPGKKYPEFETVNTNKLYYPSTESLEWIQWGDWVVIEEKMAKNDIVSKYKLSAAEIKILDEDMNNQAETSTDNRYKKYVKSLSNDIYSGSDEIGSGHYVRKVWWRSQQKINVKQSPNPYKTGEYFTHFLDDESKVVNTGQLKWDRNKKKYIDKETETEWDKKNVINDADGEKLIEKYIDIIYQGTMIGDSIYKNMGPCGVRLHSEDDYQRVPLPVVGPAYNSLTNRPYSLVWATKDIQKTYNLIFYHRELLLATSGVRGTIMDMAQKPEGMTKSEWMYYKKQGVAWIETVKKSGQINSTFNQFGQYDDSVSASIQYLDNMLIMLEEVMGNMIGVSRPTQGQVVPTDQVGTTKQSIQQSSMITEIIFADHDEVERQALEQLLNLSLKYCYKDGGIFDYELDNNTTEVFQIPAELMTGFDYKMMVGNNTEEGQALKDLKQMSFTQYDKGMLNFKQIIDIYKTKTLKDLEKKATQYIEEAEKKAQELAAQAGNAELEKESQLMQLEAQLDEKIKAQENQLKEMELQLKAKSEEMLNQREVQKMQDENKRHAMDTQVKLIDIKSEREMEGQYLQEQQRASKTEESLQALQMKMDHILDKAESQREDKRASKEINTSRDMNISKEKIGQ